MKIAVAAQGDQVSAHFGHCPGFIFYTIEDGKVSGKQAVENPGHSCQGLPAYLKEQGISLVISGGMGPGAMANLNAQGIEAITGVRGTADGAVLTYLASGLVSKGVTCSHDHAGHTCGGHSCGEHSCGGHSCSGHTCGEQD